MSYTIAFLSGVLGGIVGAGIQQLGQRYRDKRKWDELSREASIMDNVSNEQNPPNEDGRNGDLEIDGDIVDSGSSSDSDSDDAEDQSKKDTDTEESKEVDAGDQSKED
jgi:hypothetical protein